MQKKKETIKLQQNERRNLYNKNYTRKNMYKLVAIDLDGTLLNSYGEVSEKNKKAIPSVFLQHCNLPWLWFQAENPSKARGKPQKTISISFVSSLPFQ